jgi:hypothetical protein
MSTKAIREALRRWRATLSLHQDIEAHETAMAEVEAIEKATRFATTVDTSAELTPELVREAADANDILERIAKEAT